MAGDVTRSQFHCTWHWTPW